MMISRYYDEHGMFKDLKSERLEPRHSSSETSMVFVFLAMSVITLLFGLMTK